MFLPRVAPETLDVGPVLGSDYVDVLDDLWVLHGADMTQTTPDTSSWHWALAAEKLVVHYMS